MVLLLYFYNNNMLNGVRWWIIDRYYDALDTLPIVTTVPRYYIINALRLCPNHRVRIYLSTVEKMSWPLVNVNSDFNILFIFRMRLYTAIYTRVNHYNYNCYERFKRSLRVQSINGFWTAAATTTDIILIIYRT